MKKKFFVRAIGSFLNKDFELMSHDEAKTLLKSEYDRLMVEHGQDDFFDEADLDMEREEFTLYGGEKYQTMYVLPENDKEGLGYFLEEIVRETHRASDYAMCYEYELQDMQDVYDCMSKIRGLVDQISKVCSVSTRYIGACQHISSGEYGAPFVTNAGPILAYQRAQEAASNINHHAQETVFDLADVRVLRQDSSIVQGPQSALTEREQCELDAFVMKNRGKSGFVTKLDLRTALGNGMTLEDLFSFTAGQECLIFKANHFKKGDGIMYIPDLCLNEIKADSVLSVAEIEALLDQCYTGDDFIGVAEGNVAKAEELFRYCDWQHPEAVWDAGELEDEEED